MPILGSFGAGSAGGFGLGKGGIEPLDVDYLIVAAGGGSGGSGGGGGGMRTSFPGGTKITLECAVNTVTVGAGVTPAPCVGSAGGCSEVVGATTITSAGGGKGDGQAIACTTRAFSRDGGAGGGGTSNGPSQPTPVGQGNVPPVSPPQGAPGGSKPYIAGGGGGGGGASGGTGTPGQAIPQPSNPPFNGLGNGGPGGSGTSNSITGSSITYAGGGGGFAYWPGYNAGNGGSGGGGKGSSHGDGPNQQSQAGTDGLGGGSGGSQSNRGGNGVVILRYPTACAPRVSVAPGCNTTSTTGCCTYAKFNVSGTLSLG
jgi:hypothetical protein